MNEETTSPSGSHSGSEPLAAVTHKEVASVDVKKGKNSTKALKASSLFAQEPGKTILPFSRVQKILKADKELPIVSKEAVFIISKATEEFIKRLGQASLRLAQSERRATVQQKDIASVVRRADEYLFLEEIIPWPELGDAPARRKKTKVTRDEQPEAGEGKVWADFVRRGSDEREIGQLVEREDGTMELDVRPSLHPDLSN